MSAEEFDVLIVGGGPAGTVAAIELARAGQYVAVIERTAQAHDKVCGEFLSAEAIHDLEALGLRPAALGAVSIDRVQLAGSTGVSKVKLPFDASSLTRRVLDEALLEHAGGAGALVLRGHSAESLLRDGDRWCVRADGPGGGSCWFSAPHVVLATGKHDLRGLPRPAGVQSDLVAFKMYLRLAAAQAEAIQGCIELVLFREGYAGLQMEEHGTANLCCVVRKRRLREIGGGWERLTAAMMRENAHLRMRLEGAEPLLKRALAVSPIPYGFVRSTPLAERLWAVGDQAAVIPSFTGDGVALALHSGRLAAHMLVSGEGAAAYQRLFARRVRRQMRVATLVTGALVSRPQRVLVEMAVRLWPRVLCAVATSTRMPVERRMEPEPFSL